MRIDKRVLCNHFEKQALVYNSKAVVQKKIARILAEFVLNDRKVFGRIFEVGCGTGFLTNFFLKEAEIETYFLNDIVDYQDQLDFFFEQKNRCLNYLRGDIEELKFPDELDLLVSSSTVQWIQDFESFLRKSYQSLKKGGIFAFSTFGDSNYMEILNLLDVGLNYFSNTSLKSLVSSFFKVDVFESYREVLFFETPEDVLRHIQEIGVNFVKGFKFTKSKLNKFKADYESKFRTQEGFQLTYHPVILVARKL